MVEVGDALTSQSRHSLLLQGSPPSGKLLIPLNRDVRVVEGAPWKACGKPCPRFDPSLRQTSLRSFGGASPLRWSVSLRLRLGSQTDLQSSEALLVSNTSPSLRSARRSIITI